jgi:hypothetical protein
MEERFIAPPDFIRRMSGNLPPQLFNFGSQFDFRHSAVKDMAYISTIPMPDLMEQLEWNGPIPEFIYKPGFSIKYQLDNCDAFASVYVPDFETPIYRVSVTGSEVIVEFSGEPFESAYDKAEQAATVLLGLEDRPLPQGRLAPMRYAKISSIDDEVRKAFILWASIERGVYSLGRFATWRPGLLLDDLVNDVRVIERLINNKTVIYDHIKKG